MNTENTKAQMRKGILEFCILSLINNREMYVSDLIDELKKGKLDVVEGTLYPLLTRLKNGEFLAYRWEESTSGPPRKYYQITDKGKTFLMSEDVKKKISETMKGKHAGKKNPFYGKKHSEETRKRISAIHKGRKITEKEKEKRLNKIFINNGEKSTLIKKDQPIPEGWVRGRITKRSKSLINNSSK